MKREVVSPHREGRFRAERLKKMYGGKSKSPCWKWRQSFWGFDEKLILGQSGSFAPFVFQNRKLRHPCSTPFANWLTKPVFLKGAAAFHQNLMLLIAIMSLRLSSVSFSALIPAKYGCT